jgi:hypothetical protein
LRFVAIFQRFIAPTRSIYCCVTTRSAIGVGCCPGHVRGCLFVCCQGRDVCLFVVRGAIVGLLVARGGCSVSFAAGAGVCAVRRLQRHDARRVPRHVRARVLKPAPLRWEAPHCASTVPLRVPREYPCSARTVPLQYPFEYPESTCAVPVQYPFEFRKARSCAWTPARKWAPHQYPTEYTTEFPVVQIHRGARDGRADAARRRRPQHGAGTHEYSKGTLSGYSKRVL